MTTACNFDSRDCECTNVLDGDTGYRTDGTKSGEDYEVGTTRCWLIRPKLANVASIRLSWYRFDIEDGFDFVNVYDGHHSEAPALYKPPLTGAHTAFRLPVYFHMLAQWRGIQWIEPCH